MKKAVFIDKSQDNIDMVYSEALKQKLHSLVDITDNVINRENIEEYRKPLREAEVAFSTWGMVDFTSEEIVELMPSLKAVFYAAGSVQYFARPFLKNNILVISGWGANGVPVAEYTAAQIVLANKGFYQSAAKTKTNRNEAAAYSDLFPGNYRVKVGVLGAGMIGKMVIGLLKPLNIDILVYDPFLSDEDARRLEVKKASLEEIFSVCQTISNHIANLPETVGLLNKSHFNLMKDNATFINTGRGAQVVEPDLIQALKDKPGRTAVLDVTCPEPVKSGSELLELPNVFLTPHIAGSKGNEVWRMAGYMIDEFIRWEKGEELKYNVTLKMLETMA